MISNLIITNIAPFYRLPLWLKLLKDENLNISFVYGENDKMGIEQVDFQKIENGQYLKRIRKIKNIWFRQKILIWQVGILKIALNTDSKNVIFLGEMYCISTWLAAAIFRIRGRNVIFWGHGIYGNENRFKLFVRKTFYRLAQKHLLYERRGKNQMVKNGFNSKNLYVVFNSLNYSQHKKLRSEFESLNKAKVLSFFKNPNLPTVIFIGRLTKSKKIELLVKVVSEINIKSAKINLIIIGDGPLRDILEKMGQKGLTEKWIYFIGSCYEESKIGSFLSTADLCVSPGNVGLTAIHSLSFGTPVCTHNNFDNQMPEAAAIINNYNGIFFKENDINDLMKKILLWFDRNESRNEQRTKCYKIIDQYYNPNYQLSVFNRIINNLEPDI